MPNGCCAISSNASTTPKCEHGGSNLAELAAKDSAVVYLKVSITRRTSFGTDFGASEDVTPPIMLLTPLIAPTKLNAPLDAARAWCGSLRVPEIKVLRCVN